MPDQARVARAYLTATSPARRVACEVSDGPDGTAAVGADETHEERAARRGPLSILGGKGYGLPCPVGLPAGVESGLPLPVGLPLGWLSGPAGGTGLGLPLPVGFCEPPGRAEPAPAGGASVSFSTS